MTTTNADPVWPPLPDEIKANNDAIKKRAEDIASAIVDAAKRKTAQAATTADAELELNRKMVDTLATVAVGSIERTRASAQFVQVAAAAIAGLYTSALGVLYATGSPAPPRSLVPMLFLGLAIALVTFYLAFVTPAAPVKRPAWFAIPAEDMWARLRFITRYVREITSRRSGALRAAVISLFIGLFLLPIGLVRLPPETTAAATATASPEVMWPRPTLFPEAQASLAVVLYSAQLDVFAKDLDKSAPADSSREDFFAILASIVGLVIVWVVGTDRFGLFKGQDESASDEVPLPERANTG